MKQFIDLLLGRDSSPYGCINGHVDSLQLLVDLGASLYEVTVEDGTTFDLIGAGSTPLHYAASGGNAQCCQILIATGASITAENDKGWTALAVARLWHREWLEEVLMPQPQYEELTSSPYLCIPLMSVVKIALECGWSDDSLSTCGDPCAVCLENKCALAAEGCFLEFCTRCAIISLFHKHRLKRIPRAARLDLLPSLPPRNSFIQEASGHQTTLRDAKNKLTAIIFHM